MEATPAPTIQDPGWNAYRGKVIAAVADVEILMQQRGIGLDTVGMTCEVAQLLALPIDTQAQYDALSHLVRAVRSIAGEGLRNTCTAQGGQFLLPLF